MFKLFCTLAFSLTVTAAFANGESRSPKALSFKDGDKSIVVEISRKLSATHFGGGYADSCKLSDWSYEDKQLAYRAHPFYLGDNGVPHTFKIDNEVFDLSGSSFLLWVTPFVVKYDFFNHLVYLNQADCLAGMGPVRMMFFVGSAEKQYHVGWETNGSKAYLYKDGVLSVPLIGIVADWYE